MQGGIGDDTLYGDAFALIGWGGRDEIWGGAGNDRFLGDADVVDGQGGNDGLWGGGGDDRLWGDGGNDLLFGDAAYTRAGAGGNKVLWGGGGDDLILGDAQRLLCSAGDDRIGGGVGDDRLIGDAGALDDAIHAGSDAFLFRAGSGKDTILDFDDGDTGAQDLIDLGGYAIAGLGALVVADNVLDLGASAGGAADVDTVKLTFRSGSMATLDAGDFIFAA